MKVLLLTNRRFLCTAAALLLNLECSRRLISLYVRAIGTQRRTMRPRTSIMISKALFIATTWLFFALAAASSFARLVPKRRRYARDTCLSYLAFFTLLAFCTLNNIFASTYFHLSHHKEDHFRSCSSLSRLLWVSSTLNTTCLWLVKASLLASYHRFVDENASLKWAWYLVVSTTTFAYSSCVIAYPFPSDCIFGVYYATRTKHLLTNCRQR